MRSFLSIRLILTGLIFLITADVLADQTEVIDRLKSGGHILMIRHAMAPGSGDPANFKVGDCSTQRNRRYGGGSGRSAA